MIALVTGPPGSGKSFYAIHKLRQAMDAGKFVATNVELAPDAAQRVAGMNPVRWCVPGRRRSVAAGIASRTYVADELGELFRLRLPGKKEGRGVMVLDEASGWLNARNWSDKDRKDVIRFFSQHRKLGWDVYLIVQDSKMLDNQVRGLLEYEVHMRNLKKARFWGLPISPVNLFLGLWVWHAGSSRIVAKRELFRLNGARRLYDTHQVYDHGDVDGDGGLIWLPLADAGPGRRPTSASEEGDGRGEEGEGRQRGPADASDVAQAA